MQKICFIAHNIRSAHNIGSLLRTADGLGIRHVYMSGYTPYPKQPNDARLPHIADKASKLIHKTALGAEMSVEWSGGHEINNLINDLKKKDWLVIALEQSKNSVSIDSFHSNKNIAILLGNEVQGVDKDTLGHCDKIIEIPMVGHKESFNVTEAAAMAGYHLRYSSRNVQ